MKELLDIASKISDQAEVFSIRTDSGELEMRNGKVSNISASIQSGYALRILKNGRLGTAYTKNLLDRKEFVTNALNSLKGQVEASFSFPGQADLPAPWVPDGSVAEMGFYDLHARSDKVLDYLRANVEGQVDVYASRGVSDLSIVNTSGLDVSRKSAFMWIFTSLLFPNTETSVHKLFISRKAEDFPVDDLKEAVSLYRAGLPEVDIPTGRMKVIFTPDTIYTLLWRLSAASSGKAFYNRVSPLLEKRGTRVVSEKFTLYGDPTDPEELDQRFFDDEGVPIRKNMIFENGVFRNLILNLDYAGKLGEEPNGNGFRRGREPVSTPPDPTLSCGRIEPGDSSFDDMIRSMDKGVIVLGVLGAHSGNILNGDFSVGLNPGFYVENGEIKGRVKDGMIAGNVYDILGRIESVENRLHNSMMGGRYPSILLNDVSIAARE